MPSQAQSVDGSGAPEQMPVRHGRKGRVAHNTRGRVRLQFPGSSSADLQRIEAGIRGLPHVSKVEVRSRTGSVIVHHTAKSGEIVSNLGDLAKHSALFFFEGEEDPSAGATQLTDVEHDAAYLVDHSKAGKAIVRYAEHLNRAVKQVTDGWVDLRVLLPAAAGISALVFIEIESAPLWLPLALFSFQSFNNLHQPHPTTEAEAKKPGALASKAAPVQIEGNAGEAPIVAVPAVARKRSPKRAGLPLATHEGTV